MLNNIHIVLHIIVRMHIGRIQYNIEQEDTPP